MANIFTKYLNTLNELTKAYNKNKQVIKELGVEMKKSPITDSASLQKYKDNLNNLSGEITKQTLIEKEKLKVEKQLQTQIVKSITTDKKYTKALTEQKLANQENLKLQKLKIQYQKAETGSINKLNIANKRLRILLNNVNQETLIGKKRTDSLRKSIDQNTEKVKKMSDATIRQKMNIGNYGSALDKLKIKLRKVGATFGIVSKESNASRIRIQQIADSTKKTSDRMGQMADSTKKTSDRLGKLGNSLKRVGIMMLGAFGVRAAFRGLQRMFGVVTDFEKAISSLSAITGQVGGDLDHLKFKVLQTAQSTKKSSIEVAKAFELVASARPALLKNADALAAVTKQAIILSKASGLDLESAVNATTTGLAQFNIEANDSAMVIDNLAAGAKYGASMIPETTEALQKFGTIANASNMTITDSVALIETLATKQIKGSDAGIKLRNVILRLKNAGLGFVDGQFDMNAALEEAKKKFEDIEDPVKRSQEQTKLFGLRNAVAGETLLTNIPIFEDFQTKLNETGAALEQEKIQMDNVKGKTEELSSAWESFILGVDDGNGVLSDTIKGFLDLATAVLETDAAFSNMKDLADKYGQGGYFNFLTGDAQKVVLMGQMMDKIGDKIIDGTVDINKAVEKLNVEFMKSGFTVSKQDKQILTKMLSEREAMLKQAKIDEANIDAGGVEGDGGGRTVTDINKEIQAENEKLQLATTRSQAIEIQNRIKQLEAEKTTILGIAQKGNDAKLKAQAAFDLKMQTFGLDGREKELEDLQIWYEKQKADFIEFGGDMELLETEHLDRNAEIDAKYRGIEAAKKAEITNIEASQWETDIGITIDRNMIETDLLIAKLGKEIKLEEEANEKREQLRQENREKTVQVASELAGQLGEILGTSLADQELSMKEAAKQMLIITIKTLEGIITAAIIEAAVKSIATKGLLIGTAEAALKVAAIKTASAFAIKSIQKFEHGGTWVEGGQLHSQGGNVYGNKEFEKGEMGAIFSRPATKKYGSEIESFTNAANNLKLQQFYDNKTDVDFGETNGYLKQLVNNSNQEIISSDGRVIGKREGNSTTWYD